MDLGTDAALTLNDTYSGTIIMCGGATCAVTLPAPSALIAGWWCRFIVNNEAAAVTITGTADTIIGHVVTGPDNDERQLQPPSAGLMDVVSFTTAVLLGDWVELVCDGSQFHITGSSRIADAITVTSP